jgi:hypothetical protein
MAMRTYFNPLQPQGMVTWGSLVTLLIFYYLLQIHGQLSEVWPHRCQILKTQLQMDPVYQLKMVVHGEDQEHGEDQKSLHLYQINQTSTLNTTDLVKSAIMTLLLAKDQSIHLPNLPYQEVTINIQNQSTQHQSIQDWFVSHQLSIELKLDKHTTIRGYGKLDLPMQSIDTLIRYMTGQPQAHLNVPSASHLIYRSLKKQPKEISCYTEDIDQEVIDMLALTYKSTLAQHHQVNAWGGGWQSRVKWLQEDYYAYHWAQNRDHLPNWIQNDTIHQAQHRTWVWTWLIPTKLMDHLKQTVPSNPILANQKWITLLSDFLQNLNTDGLKNLRVQWNAHSKVDQFPKLIVKE